MPCYLRKVRMLPLSVRQSLVLPSDFEERLDEALGSKTHRETEEKIGRMSEREFYELILTVLRRRRRKRRFEEEKREVAAYV